MWEELEYNTYFPFLGGFRCQKSRKDHTLYLHVFQLTPCKTYGTTYVQQRSQLTEAAIILDALQLLSQQYFPYRQI